jgi:hypothetical protein
MQRPALIGCCFLPQEAAELYEKAGLFEKAATIYIQTKNFSAATPLMAKVTSTKLLLQYAKAKEAEGRFADAAQASRVQVTHSINSNYMFRYAVHWVGIQRVLGSLSRARVSAAACI